MFAARIKKVIMKISLTILILIFTTSLSAQDKRGANWILGVHYTTPTPEKSDGTLLNFKDDTLKVEYIEEGQYMSMGLANTGISDTEGNLLFYTNGCYIANALHDTLKNSEALSPGFVELVYCDDRLSPFSQHQMIIPKPGSNHLYYVMQLNDIVYAPFRNGISVVPGSLTYSVVDINAENGLGAVIEKNTELLRDTFSNSGLHMTKHANGRDWWLIAPVFASNCYYKYLITPTEISLVEKQCVGDVWGRFDYAGQSTFSPDGSHYIRFHTWNGLDIFSFDRCNGQLMSKESMSFIRDTNKTVGVAVSPNSRFLYAMVSDSAFQYDLWASDIEASKLLIAVYDGFTNPGPTRFRLAQLAPDGKIYVASNINTFNLHVIEHPDSLGTACNFVQHKIELPTVNDISIPIYPNYALGPLPGECDTLPVSTTELLVPDDLRLYPNPATDEVFIESKEGLPATHLQVSDSQGRVMISADLQTGIPTHRLNTTNWPDGLYMVWLKSEEGWQWRKKLLILRE